MEVRNLSKIVRNMNLYKNSVSEEESPLNGTEFELLRYVCKREERPYNEVVEYLNVDKGLVSRMTKKLEKLGYLEILPDKTDSRKKILKPTEEALKIKDLNYHEEVRFYNACLQVLNDEEKAEFDRLLEKVYLESKRLRKSKFEEIKNEKA